VDQVMQAHGGKVTVSSEKDKFSEFTLYIPKETHKTHSIHDKITLG
jgi:signal transduction histidine kinase